MLTDAEFAQAFRLRKRRYRGTPEEEAKHLESNLTSFLATHVSYVMLSEHEQVLLKNRVLTILRSESGTKGAATRKRKRRRQSVLEEYAALSVLQLNLDLARKEPDHDT